MPKVAYAVATAVGREFPNLRKQGHIIIDEGTDVITVHGLADDDVDAFIKDVESIVYSAFDGRVKSIEWAVAEGYGYVQFSVIPETAKVI